MRGEGEANITATADAGAGDAIRIGNKVCGAPNLTGICLRPFVLPCSSIRSMLQPPGHDTGRAGGRSCHLFENSAVLSQRAVVLSEFSPGSG